MRTGIDCKGHKWTFWGMENIDNVYTSVHICQNLWHCVLYLNKANCQPINNHKLDHIIPRLKTLLIASYHVSNDIHNPCLSLYWCTWAVSTIPPVFSIHFSFNVFCHTVLLRDFSTNQGCSCIRVFACAVPSVWDIPSLFTDFSLFLGLKLSAYESPFLYIFFFYNSTSSTFSLCFILFIAPIIVWYYFIYLLILFSPLELSPWKQGFLRSYLYPLAQYLAQSGSQWIQVIPWRILKSLHIWIL